MPQRDEHLEYVKLKDLKGIITEGAAKRLLDAYKKNFKVSPTLSVATSVKA